MHLTLTNGYPFPYPSDVRAADVDRFAKEASGNVLHVEAVIGFEWKYTLTIEFANTDVGRASRDRMLALGWCNWGPPGALVLEAPTSAPDGYGHPAIIAGAFAYCGFIVSG
jgi:hypothetical protein